MPQAVIGCDHALIGLSPVLTRQACGSARTTSSLAKIDRVNARVLAQMGAALDLPVTIPLSPAHPHLANFLGRCGQLVDTRKAGELHRHRAGQSEIAHAIEAMIDLSSWQIADLNYPIAGFIAQDQVLSDQADLLSPAPASNRPS